MMYACIVCMIQQSPSPSHPRQLQMKPGIGQNASCSAQVTLYNIQAYILGRRV